MSGNKDKMIYCVSCLCEHEHGLVNDEWICPACDNPVSSGILELMEERENLANKNKMFANKLSELGYTEEQIGCIAHGNLVENRVIPTRELYNKIDTLAKEYSSLYSDEMVRSDDIEKYGENEFYGGMAEAFKKSRALLDASCKEEVYIVLYADEFKEDVWGAYIKLLALEQHCRGVKLVIAAKEVLSNEQE
jgi:hypothetical protein